MGLGNSDFSILPVWYVVFLFSTTCHEASHAWVAKRGGDFTAYHGGQVSLDPLAHIRREPIGMVVLPILSLIWFGWPFGYASAPYDPLWARTHHKQAAYMSLAGPLANFALVLLAAGLIRLGFVLHHFSPPERITYTMVAEGEGLMAHLALVVSMLFSLNLILGIFNLVPLPPLDGSGVIPLFLSQRLAAQYRHLISSPMFGMMGLLIAWKIFDPLFHPVFVFTINWLYPGVRYGG